MREKITAWMKGDEEAAAFIVSVHEIVELWDDLIDRDKTLEPESINTVFHAALITLPRNAFYRRHFLELNPILESAILDWHTANALEARRQGDDLHGAFMLRCGVMALTTMSAKIIGGVMWARQVGMELRSDGESWADYLKGFGENNGS